MKMKLPAACFILALLLAIAGCVPIPPPAPAPVAEVASATLPETRGGVDVTATPEPECPVEVSKDAFAFQVEVQRWTIAKASEPVTLTLAAGQTAQVDYTVTLDADEAAVISAWIVTGTITITNPSAVAAPIVDIVDVLSPAPEITATVACEEELPFELPAGETLLCRYAAELPDSSDRLNTVTVMLDAAQADRGANPDPEPVACAATADAQVATGQEAITIDQCVEVGDSVRGALGEACVTDTLPAEFTYTRTLGPLIECGTSTITNTATYTATDTLTTDVVTHTLTIDAACAGCCYTQGYWKNHADKPDKYNDAWDSVGLGGPATLFYLSGKNWLQVLETSSAGGNAYYILAQQFIAAKLNMWAGASYSAEVRDAVVAAEAFFTTAVPEPEPADPQRAELIKIATLLDEYNNGNRGPEHCD